MKRRSLAFMGSKEGGLRALRRLLDRMPASELRAVICPDDRGDARSVLAEFESVSRTHDVPLHLVTSAADTADLLRSYRPSAAIVHGWYRLIPVDDFPDTDFFGFHYSPLPRYRGNAPLVWQIINGEKRLAVSFFVLSSGMDDGDLLDQRFFDLSADEDIADALVKANELVDGMLDDFVPRWISGEVLRFAQPEGPASYCGMRLPEDGRIDWKLPAPALHDFVRAQARPYPGAFAVLPDGRKITFCKTAVEPRVFYGSPGALLEKGSSTIVVACGSGALRVIRVLVEDGPEQAPGAVFGSLKARLK